MNVAVVALLGMTAGQPPADTYVPWTDRRVPLPIHYDHDPKAIAQVQLWVSDDGGQLWKKVLAAPPTQKEFLYVAPADGRYWFHIVVVDLKGGQDPPNLAAEPPAQMVLIDTKPPQVLVTAARRDGESITVEWKVEDQFPNDAATQVSFRPLGSPDAAWKEVRLPPGPPGGVRFPAGTTGPVQVRVAVADRVGQTAEAVKDFPAAGAAGPTSTSLSAGTGAPAAGPTTPVPPPDSLAPAPPATGGPLAPAAPPPMQPATPPAAEPVAQPAGPQPVATFDPRAGSAPPSPGGATAPPPPPADPARVIASPRFELNYQVELQGSSKVGRIDLWVTRDDGRTWAFWSRHPGNDPVVRVDLGAAHNRQLEGLYGFRLVSVSGAGLSDTPPAGGDAPEFRLVVDLTRPDVRIYPPEADPHAPEALVLRWWAGDANFGDDPITLEWSETPAPPWRPVVPAAEAPVLQAGGPPPAGGIRRLPNTGRYSWRVPPGLPPRVYLKVTARDAAGNTTEQVTRDPVLIDLTKPRAKITGIGGTARQ